MKKRTTTTTTCLFSSSSSSSSHADDQKGTEDAQKNHQPPQLPQSPDPVASRVILDQLIPRKTIVELSSNNNNNRKGLEQFLFSMGSYVVVAYSLSTMSTTSAYAAKPCLQVLLAFLASFFFHGLHETVHGTAFASTWCNRIAKHWYGFWTFRPACHYYWYHWQHHQFTGNITHDSELAAANGGLLDFPITSPGTYLLYLSGIPFWIDAITTLMRHARGKCPEMYLTKSTKATTQVIREARIYLMLYVFLLGGTLLMDAMNGTRKAFSFLVHYWLLPAFWGQPFLRFYLLAEHRGRKTTPKNILENTRTMPRTPWIVQKLAWNMPYHLEHHAWPSIPFWKLPHVHNLLVQGILSKQRQGKGDDHDNDIDDDAAVRQVLSQGDVNPRFSNKGYMALNWEYFKSTFRS